MSIDDFSADLPAEPAAGLPGGSSDAATRETPSGPAPAPFPGGEPQDVPSGRFSASLPAWSDPDWPDPSVLDPPVFDLPEEDTATSEESDFFSEVGSGVGAVVPSPAPVVPGIVPGKVGVVGSPSSTATVTVEITRDAEELGLVGSMVVIPKQFTPEVSEEALGTVTEAETKNQWHENVSMRGVIAEHGALAHLSGRADVRAATVDVQAVYRHEGEAYVPAGANLSMSPRTGTEIFRVNNDLLAAMTAYDSGSLFCLGDIYRMPGVHLPFNTNHFDTSRGAFHAGVFGASGSGKSWFAAYYVCGQLRHEDLGVLLIDPQQQFSLERDLPFSLQGAATALGREVRVHNLATDVRLPKNRNLFTKLLDKSGLLQLHLVQHPQNRERARARIAELLQTLKDRDDWTSTPADVLFEKVLAHLGANAESVYSSKAPREEFLQRVENLRARPGSALGIFRSVLTLFAPVNLADGKRTPVESILQDLFARHPGKPRAFLVFNMTTPVADDDDDDGDIHGLADDAAKALILQEVFRLLEQAASRAYATGSATGGRDARSQADSHRLLNTMVVFDEAARYAPARSDVEEIKDLAASLARYARETRKFGIGWFYILQEPKDLHPSVWAQLSSGFRAVGYGLGGFSLNLVEEHLDSPASLRLYRSFPQPTGSGQYPFMVLGAVSPLSFTKAPVFLNVAPSFDAFSVMNTRWLPPHVASAATF